jgi:phenylpropionate dioxygenase-like ring-hydroxylating dioxygenase large terminal subunit
MSEMLGSEPQNGAMVQKSDPQEHAQQVPHITDGNLRALVREDRVHRSVYLDPAIFELEMERIFGRAWLLVGHDSQVPNIGDFHCTTLGRVPVIMSRGDDGEVHVLHNRCAHRGAKVVNTQCGNVKRFRCMYHSWSYHTDGRLASVPLQDGFPADFDLKDRSRGMVPLEQVAIYRGFVFAKMIAAGPTLLEHLGDARFAIDEVVDRSPIGEIEVTGGFHRYSFKGNWKHQIENLADQYHAPFSHESTVTPDGYQFSRRPGETGTRIKILNKDGTPGTEAKGQWWFPWGHNACGAQSTDGDQGGEVFDRYRAEMERTQGAERTKELLTHKRHLAFFYPNFDLHVLAQAIRIVRPIDVNLTEVQIYPIRLKGAPDAMFHDTVRLLNITHSCSSLSQTDDVEAFERIQIGLQSPGDEWIRIQRGLGLDVVDPVRGGMMGPQYSEAGIRNQHRAWLRYMAEWTTGAT